MILLCYDGSEDARDAIDRAATLFRGAPATVLAVWLPYAAIVTQTSSLGIAFPPPLADLDEIEAAIQDDAQASAQEGADRATRAGMRRRHVASHGAPAWPRRSSRSPRRSTPR